MNSNESGKLEPVNPEDAVRLLELELIQKRAARQMAGARWRGLRAASFFFLFVVIVGALLAFYFLFASGRLSSQRTPDGPQPSPSTASIPPSS